MSGASMRQGVGVPLAVVGVSAMYPGSIDKNGFWWDILAGKDLVTDVPPTHWLIEDYYDPNQAAPDKTYGKRGAFLSNVDFDPLEFAMPPSNLPSTDTSQLLALVVAKKVLEDAATGQFAAVDRERISVILGVASTTELVVELGSRLQRPVWVKAMREAGLPEDEVVAICDRISNSYVPWTESSFPGLLGNVVAGRIANRFDLGGTNCVIDAACASSLAATHLAMLELQSGTSDLVIAGGVDTLNDILMYECFSKTPALSPTGDCRPFSAKADGTILGEGLGMVALRRLEDAERDGNRIYGVIRGLGTSSDGKSKSVYAPVPAGQAKALRRAYENAGFGPETVELVEAHGTATRAGDAAEFEGIKTVFGAASPEGRQWCALGSVKSQIGHTKAAAGAAGLFKAVMSLHHKVLPPTIKVDEPNPSLDLENSPFYLNTEARPWIRDDAHPRRAAVSSFGFGGSNYHVALEEYTGSANRPGRVRTSPTELILLAAESAQALAARCRSLAPAVAEGGGLQYWARRSQEEFVSTDAHRVAVIAPTEAGLRQGLLQAADRLERHPGENFSLPTGVYYGTGPAIGGLAFLFPGQGSQRVGMGAEVVMSFDSAREVWDRAASLRLGENGERLHQVVFPAPVFSEASRKAQATRLTATEWAQPALGAASLAHLALLRQVGIQPDCVGGHSFGELTALCAAGVLEPADLLQVARKRGKLMAAAAATPGAMAAVSGGSPDLVSRVQSAGIDVVAANYNSPQQVVFSGTVAGIEALERWLEPQAGLSSQRLPVSTGFHSNLVSPSVEPFLDYLQQVEFGLPKLPVYANSLAQIYPQDPQSARTVLANQLAKPVRFAEQVEAMYAAGTRIFVEVGPGSVLSAMVEQTLKGRPVVVLSLERKGLDGMTGLWHALGRLAAAGVQLNPAALWQEYAPVDDPAQRKRPNLVVPINGANYGRPYPPAGGAAALPKPNPPRPVAVAPAAPLAPVVLSAPVPAQPPAPAPVFAGGDGLSAVLQSIEAMHRETALAHTAYQTAMADSHIAYLNAMEAATGSLTALFSGQQQGWSATPSLPRALASKPSLLVAAGTDPGLPAVALPVPAPAYPPTAVAPPPAAPGPSQPMVQVGQPAPAPGTGVDLKSLLLSVVADKTGYPVEMLDLGLELEAGLGIDSIKRVEILSSLRERAPGLPEVQPAQLASLRTLAEIITFMEQHGAAPTQTVAAKPPVVPGFNLQAILLEVVADKTGYPAEMLDLSLELEAGLGIDSIKRVEILSALRERAPGLPEVQPAQLASLRTLGEIIAFMDQNGVVSASATPPVALVPLVAAPSAPSPEIDLTALLLAVVADKTGYPAEMLDLTMELESGLGIDSIKRVEILSAIRERAPGLPEVQPAQLATLRTLAEIIAFMQQGQPTETAPVSTPTIQGPVSVSLDRFEVSTIPALPTGFAMPGLIGCDGIIAVTDDGLGVAPLVIEQLAHYGVKAEVVNAPPIGAPGLICLAGLRSFSTEESAMDANREAFRAARSVAERLSSNGGLFVTVQDTGGDFGLSGRADIRSWSAGLAGLAKTAAREWPQAAVKAIDLECGGRTVSEIAQALVNELLFGGPELEVGLTASGDRTTLACQPAAAPAGTEVLSPGDVIVATGGARGVTAGCLKALAVKYRPRIALLGRTSLPAEPESLAAIQDEPGIKRFLLTQAQGEGRQVTPVEIGREATQILAAREVRATLADLERSGAEARYFPCDAQDTTSVEAVLVEVRRTWGQVAAIVHGAGVLADKLIAQKTDEQFERVFQTKVGGLRTLLQATATDPLKMICLFSSVAARTGNLGQCDYAIANEILNKVAAHEAARRPNCTVRSIGWGPWDGGMVTPALRAHFQQQGVALIPPTGGEAAFVQEWKTGGTAEIVLGCGAPHETLTGTEQRQWAMGVLVDQDTYPFLTSHQIQDVPVVPVVLVLEWLVRASLACRPDLGMPKIKDLKVLRGVRLDHWNSEPHLLGLHVSESVKGDQPALRFKLSGPGGVLHYTALAEFGPADGPGLSNAVDPALGPWGWQVADLYDGKLFHGPDFQAIRELQGVSERSAAAVFVGARALGWNCKLLRTDPAAMDGALQLARLWGINFQGYASLPTRVGSVTLHRSEPVSGPLQCILHAATSSNYRTVFDIALVSSDGSPIADLNGVEMHMLVGESVAD